METQILRTYTRQSRVSTSHRWADAPPTLDLVFTYNTIEIQNIRYHNPFGTSHNTLLEFDHAVCESIK